MSEQSTSKNIPNNSSQEAPFIDLLNQNKLLEVEEILPSGKNSVEKAPKREQAPSRTFLVRFGELREKSRTDTGNISKSKPRSYKKGFLLQNAKLLMEHHEYQLAMGIFSDVLSRNIREPEALEGLGICLFNLKRFKGARACFQALDRLEAGEQTAYWLGRCFYASGQVAEAVNMFRKVFKPLELSRERRFLYFKELGNCLLRQKDISGAETAYENAEKVIPNSTDIHVNLGMLRLQCKEFEKARSHFKQALASNPECAKAHFGMGFIAAEMENWEASQMALCSALNFEALNQGALLKLISVVRITKDFRLIQEYAKGFLEKAPKDTAVRYGLAQLYFEAQNWKLCQQFLKEVLLLEPEHSGAKALESILSKKTIENVQI